MNTTHAHFRVLLHVAFEEEARWLRRHTNRTMYAEKPERLEPTIAVQGRRRS